MKLLYNARIYTLARSRPTASALACERERVVAVGGEELLAEFPHAEKENMGGRILLPGLTDAHIHLMRYALALQQVDCETVSKEECLRRVAARVAEARPGAWVCGHGWNQNEWDGAWPTAAELDRIAPHTPVFLTAKSLHAAWANSAALRLAGVDAATPDPPNGQFLRDEHGQPTGILLEEAYLQVQQAIPLPTPEEVAVALRAVQPRLWQMGLTGVHDFDPLLSFQALQYLQERGELTLRVVKSIPLENLSAALEIGLRTGFGNDLLRIGSVKAFADGALGPRTAAMLDPYIDEPQNCGILNLTADQVFEIGRRAAAGGLSLAVHAIGDRANREVLDGFARLRQYERQRGLPALRHRIEHVQVIHPDDAGRLGQLGLAASMQPLHAPSDMLMADRFLGERAAWSYGWQTQVRRGARLAFGSDAPVESPNPFWGLYAAVTRRRLDGSPGPQGWHPEERLSLQTALEAFTGGPAYLAGMENRLGRLADGYLADLIVLDADPFACPADDLHLIKPIATMLGGDWVWRS